MTQFEYKVVPAPKRGERVRGVKAAEDRFALAMAAVLNAQGAEGWEYQRTDTLPSEEREGLMGKATVFQNMMVFRRAKVLRAEPAPPEPPRIEDKRAEVAAPVAPIVTPLPDPTPADPEVTSPAQSATGPSTDAPEAGATVTAPADPDKT